MAVCCAAFGAGYMLLAVLVPLYAHARGASAVTVGLLASVPVVMQVPTRLFSGALTDLWGEHRLLYACSAAALAAGLAVPLGGGSLGGLVVAQLLIGGARGAFWIGTQSYVARLPTDVARSLGWQSSFTNVGSLAGVALGGALAARFGFLTAFGVVAVLGGATFLGAAALPAVPRGAVPRSARQAVAALGVALLDRRIWFCGGVAFLTAIPQALSQSFYPVFAVQLGASLAGSAEITALRNLGMIATGFLAAALLRRFGGRGTVAVSLALLGLTLAACGLWHSLGAFAASVALAGAAAGVTNVFFLSTAALMGGEQTRAANLAAVNFTFAVAMGIMPTGFGLLAAHTGTAAAFLPFAAASLAGAVVAPVLAKRVPGLERNGAAQVVGAPAR
jgi:MFS family permease